MQDAVTAEIVAQVARALAPDLTARPATEADRAAYVDLSVAGLAAHARAVFGLDEATVRRGVDEDFAPERLTVITQAGEPLGVLTVEARPGELWLDQIVIAASHRSRGLGARVVRAVQRAATTRGDTIGLSVLAGNPARALYARLGFAIAREVPPRTYMRWTPPAA